MVSEASRIKMIRALIGPNGIKSRDLAKRLGVQPLCVTMWETGKSVPQGRNRESLAKLCQENGIAFLPTGCPVPLEDMVQIQQYRGML